MLGHWHILVATKKSLFQVYLIYDLFSTSIQQTVLMDREVTEKNLKKNPQYSLECPLHFPHIFVRFYFALRSNQAVSACELCRLGMLLESLPWSVSLGQVEYAEFGQLSSEQELPKNSKECLSARCLHWRVPRRNTIRPANLWGITFYSPQWSFFHQNCSLWVAWKTMFWL